MKSRESYGDGLMWPGFHSKLTFVPRGYGMRGGGKRERGATSEGQPQNSRREIVAMEMGRRGGRQ